MADGGGQIVRGYSKKERFIMSSRTFVLAALVASASGVASAQDHRVEVGGNIAYTLSDGVTFDGLAVGGNVFNSIEPKDSVAYGLNLGVFVTESLQVEFLWSRQDSNLQAGGTTEMEITDLSVDNYMGNVVYHFGDSASGVRPYVFGGLGATSYGSLSFVGLNGQQREIGGETKFATNWGAGLKLYAGERVGLKLGARWTPTYVKSDPAGYWCDPYWGCYTVGDAQYSNQFEFSGGLFFRF
jgi:outer membrane protein W